MDPPNFHPPDAVKSTSAPEKAKSKSTTKQSAKKKDKSPKAERNNETQVCSLIAYIKIIEALGEAERNIIKAVGLESLLRLCPVKIRRNLCRWIAEQYKEDIDCFKIGDYAVQLTRQEFEHLFGFPAHRVPLGTLPETEVSPVLRQITEKKQKRIPLLYLQDIIKKGIQSKSDELPFLQAFILYTIGCILCPTTQRYVSAEYLQHVATIEAIMETNLVKLSLDHLFKSINQYNAALKDPERGLKAAVNLEGNLPLLQFWFWEKFRVDRINASIDYKGREPPLLQFWDEKKASKVCGILNEHGREAGELVHDLHWPWEPPSPRASSPLPSWVDDLPSTDTKMVVQLAKSFSKMRYDVMMDNISTRKEIVRDRDILYRIEEKLDTLIAQQTYNNEDGPSTVEYRTYKDFTEDGISPLHARNLDQTFETPDTNKKHNKRPSDKVDSSPRKQAKLQDDTIGAKKREQRNRKPTHKNKDFVYFDPKIATKPKRTPNTVSTQITDEDVQGEVIDYVNASPPKEVLVIIDDLELLKEELTCLTTPVIRTATEGWLNTHLMDAVITWMRHMRPQPDIRDGGTVYMERASVADVLVRDGSVAAYNSDVRSKKDGTTMGKMYISHDMIIMPLNHENVHWVVVNVDPKNRQIQVLDSARNGKQNFKKSHPELEHMLKGMEAHLDVTSRHECQKSSSWPDYAVNSWPVRVVKDVPQQRDGKSCGLFALKNMENWIGYELSKKFTQSDVDKFRKEIPALLIDSPMNEAPREAHNED